MKLLSALISVTLISGISCQFEAFGPNPAQISCFSGFLGDPNNAATVGEVLNNCGSFAALEDFEMTCNGSCFETLRPIWLGCGYNFVTGEAPSFALAKFFSNFLLQFKKVSTCNQLY